MAEAPQSSTALRTMPQPSQAMSQAISDGLVMFSPAQMLQRVAIIDEIRKTVMQVNTDYYSLQSRKVKDPETGVEVEVPQYSLSKAGAEKLCLTFGLTPEIETSVVVDDPTSPRVIQVPLWVDDPNRPGKQKKTWVDQPVTGFYEVKSTCSVWSANGRLLSRASGNCNSTEAAFRSTPYSDAKNPILKRSEKRALVAAVLIATASSGMFTQDLEDLMGDEHGGSGQAGAQGARPAATNAGTSRPSGQQGGGQQGGGARLFNVSENQEKLIFAKSKKRNPVPDPDVVKHIVTTLKSLDYATGKKYFDQIADEGPEAERLWTQAIGHVADKKAGSAPAPAAATPQAPDAAAAANSGDPLPPPPAAGDGF